MALALREWLPDVLQSADPWMSDVDTAAGTMSMRELFKQLDQASVGIIALTPENLNAPWLLFEAGALSKRLTETGYVCPYLLGLKTTDVLKPLGEFQGCVGDQEGTLKLVQTVNKCLQDNLSNTQLGKAFDRWWPDLHAKLQAIQDQDPVEPTTRRDTDDILLEVLDSTRELMRRNDEDRRRAESPEFRRKRMEALTKEMTQAQQTGWIAELFKKAISDPSLLAFLQSEQAANLDTAFHQKYPFAEASSTLADFAEPVSHDAPGVKPMDEA